MLINYYYLPDYNGWQVFNGGIVPEGYEVKLFIHSGLMIKKNVESNLLEDLPNKSTE